MFRLMLGDQGARTTVTDLWSARDALDLRLFLPDGAPIPVDYVTVYDFGETLDREREVELADVAVWQRARTHGGAG